MGKKKKSFVYEIFCADCSALVMRYHKSSKGALLRCFIKGIEDYDPLDEVLNTKDEINKADLPNLECPDCSTLIGVPMIYKDGRLAYRMINGRFGKRLDV